MYVCFIVIQLLFLKNMTLYYYKEFKVFYIIFK